MKNFLKTMLFFNATIIVASLLLSLSASLLPSSLGAESLVVYIMEESTQKFIPVRIIGTIKTNTKILIPKDVHKTMNYRSRMDHIVAQVSEKRYLDDKEPIYVIEIEKDGYLSKYGNLIVVLDTFTLKKNNILGHFIEATGRLDNVKDSHYIAQPLFLKENRTQATILQKEGDFYRNQGDFVRAIHLYKKSLQFCHTMPEIHFALASTYLKLYQTKLSKKQAQAIVSEFSGQILPAFEQAWEYRNKFKYPTQQIEFYMAYMDFLLESYRTKTIQEKPVLYLEKVMEIAAASKQDIDKYAIPFLIKNPYAENQFSNEEYKIEILQLQTYSYLIEYYKTQASPLERKAYDIHNDQLRLLLKKLLEQKIDVSSLKLYRLALLYYTSWHKQLSSVISIELVMKNKLHKIIFQNLLPKYRIFMQNQAITAEDRKIKKNLQNIK